VATLSKFDAIASVERRFEATVEVSLDSPPGVIYFLDGDGHWLLDLNTGLSSKPYPSGRIIVGHPETIAKLAKRYDVVWPSVESSIIVKG